MTLFLQFLQLFTAGKGTDYTKRPRLSPAPTDKLVDDPADVGFAYAPGNPVLKQFNMTTKATMTLSKLLFRFYDPTEGAVEIDGTDIRSVSLDSVRRAIAVVPQDCVLFNDSLRENIRYGGRARPMRKSHRLLRPPIWEM